MPNGSASESERATDFFIKKNLNCFGGRILVNADTKFVTVPIKTVDLKIFCKIAFQA